MEFFRRGAVHPPHEWFNQRTKNRHVSRPKMLCLLCSVRSSATLRSRLRLSNLRQRFAKRGKMTPPKKDPTIAALEAVHSALKPLEKEERQRVLSSVYALLEIAPPESSTTKNAVSGTSGQSPGAIRVSISPRPLGITELIQQKRPGTHPEYIALFAYYREKHQGLPNFSRADLEKYYAASHTAPPKNYTRDFISAMKRGWIHEDGDNSYITSKGIEVVESNFADGHKSARKDTPRAGKPHKKPRKKKR